MRRATPWTPANLGYPALSLSGLHNRISESSVAPGALDCSRDRCPVRWATGLSPKGAMARRPRMASVGSPGERFPLLV